MGPVLSLEVLRGIFGMEKLLRLQLKNMVLNKTHSWYQLVLSLPALRGATGRPFGQVRNGEPKSAMS